MTTAPAAAPVADRWLTAPVECGPRAGFGVYLHVPFCAHRCSYCDFATYDDRPHLVDRYVAALRTDLGRAAAAGPPRASPSVPDAWPVVTSVFVGGGTPSLLAPAQLAAVVRAVFTELEVAADAEITVECNPEDASPELFGALAGAGVNRVSMGAQSFAPHVLATLERRHRAARPVAAVGLATAAGIRDVSLDLIYGTPGETDNDWRESLSQVIAAGVGHVAAYALTIHANTPFGRRIAAGAMPPPDDDVQRDRFDAARDTLAAAGFDHYEISNWSQGPSRRSRHNLLYWRHGDYLGVGVAAHGHWRGRRWWSHRSVERYLDAVSHGLAPVAGTETPTTAERAEERLLLGLRVKEGLHPGDVPPLDPDAVADAVAAGLVTTGCGRLQASDDGWFLLDEAVSRLL